MVIIQHGRLVAERYMPGYSAETPLLSWSMAKSITQALVGIAVRRGLVDIDKPMGNPRWAAGDPRAAIPWRQWINMIDGQDYHEIGVIDQTRNDAARMLYGAGRLDVAGFGAGLPLVHPPGTHWNYNSAGVNLIAAALGRVVRARRFADASCARACRRLLRDELFAPHRHDLGAAGVRLDRQLHRLGAGLRDGARLGALRPALPARRRLGRTAHPARGLGRLRAHQDAGRQLRRLRRRLLGDAGRPAAASPITRWRPTGRAICSSRRDTRGSSSSSCRRRI